MNDSSSHTSLTSHVSHNGKSSSTNNNGSSKPARVLVVDDNPVNTELVRFVLEADGIAVEAAGDAAEAQNKLTQFVPDLILMDIQMPGVDGLELTRRLRADPHTRRISVVAFTAYAMKGDRARMLANGCDGYIAKPIDMERFAGQVRDWLRLS